MYVLLKPEKTCNNTSIKADHVDIMHKTPFQVKEYGYGDGDSFELVSPMDGYKWSFQKDWLLVFYPDGKVIDNKEDGE